MKPYLSVIVPAYQKQSTILTDLRHIQDVLKHIRYPSELICVVDGKTDQTFAIASKFAQSTSDVRVVSYPHNRGKGYAIRFGMAQSRGQIIAFLDAGMEINPNGLSMLLEHFEWYHADIVVGSKRHPVSKVSYPWQRRILSWGYQLLVRTLFGLKIRDTQTGLKCFRSQVLQDILPRLVTDGYAFDIEVLAVAQSAGFTRIFEAPVEMKLDFGGASVLTGPKLLRFCFTMLLDTLTIFYRLTFTSFYHV